MSHIQVTQAAAASTLKRFPASWTQEQWWFLDQWRDRAAAGSATTGRAATNSAATQCPAADRAALAAAHLVALRIKGVIDLAALRAAVADLVARHEALRTVFVLAEGRLEQEIAAPPADPLLVVNASEDAAQDPESRVARIVAEQTRHAFDESAPLFHARLDLLGPDDHLLSLTAHPSIADQRSMTILVRDLNVFYASRRAGESPRLAALDSSYAEYAAQQRALLDGPYGNRLDSYWRECVAAAASAELPVDHTRPATMSFRSDRVEAVIEQRAVQRLERAADDAGTDLETALLAATAVVVARHAASDQVTLGLAHDGRPAPELEHVVGPFCDLVPVTLEISGAAEVPALLAAVRAERDNALAHAATPFPRIAQQATGPRDSSRHPVFQIGVEVTAQDGAGIDGALGCHAAAAIEAASVDQRLDLWVRCARSAVGDLWIRLDYATDLYDSARMHYLAGHVAEVLRAIADGASGPVAQLPMMTEHERGLLERDWQGESRPAPTAMVHDLFARQAVRTPHAVAVEEPGRRVTYAQLDLASTRLANHLRDLGVGPDVPVGMSLERGIEAVTAILAILKAGGAYLPLDPTYPAERLTYVLEDSGAPVLITREGLLPLFGATHAARAVLVDRDADELARVSEAPVPPAAGPDNLVYVMYTSGSTGRPKGVRTLHRNLSWYLDWFIEAIGADAFRRVFGTIAFSFDVSAMDIWPPLLTGGRLRLTEGLLAVPEDCAEFDGVTLMNLVPSVLAEFLRHNRLPKGLRTITVGGEHLSDQLLADIFRNSDVTDVWHLYGPTETTVFVTAQHLRRDHPEPITIGRPVFSTRVDILDRHGRIAPIGVPGELHVSGPCVADGYLDRPELTAQRFLPNPHAPGAVMYRTGDMARWGFDGQIEFLGRVDNQVKIRGVRIELGEIEAALERHPDVASAVVAVKENVAGAPELVGYLVAGPAGADLDAVRSFVQERLPSFLVPTALLAIAEIPRSPVGKVDRKALPTPAQLRSGGPHAAPSTPAERLLADVWKQLLDRPQVGIDDNFFQIGGHSLLAIRAMREVERHTGVKLPVRTLFRAPVLGAFAVAVTQGLTEAGRPLAALESSAGPSRS